MNYLFSFICALIASVGPLWAVEQWTNQAINRYLNSLSSQSFEHILAFLAFDVYMFITFIAGGWAGWKLSNR